jgi:dolichyl-phosphate-mannose--protein O-mannosyl transferase
VVFDEAHHALYATKYLSRQYYFDTHPPLGKMLFGLAGFLVENKTGFAFEIGKDYGDFNYLALRSLTAFCGSLFIILIYFLVKEMGFSQRVAFLASSLILFDNAFLVQSRFILLDIILLFFIFLSLYLFLLTKKYQTFSKKWYLFNFLTGLAMGTAFSIKWPGFGVLIMVWASNIVLDSFFSKSKKEKLIKICFLFILPFLLYFFFFFLHFHFAYLPCYSNCGAIIEKIERMQIDSKNKIFTIPPPGPPSGNLLRKFLITHGYMLAAAMGENYFLYRSPWWSWPLMTRPVPYFYEKVDGKISVIYFLGNPIVWSLGIIGILGFFYLMIKRGLSAFRLKLSGGSFPNNFLFLSLGWLIYFLSFGGIGRQVPVYYYLPALTFSIICFSLFLEEISKIIFKSEKKINILFLVILISAILGFIGFSPFSYGFPLS